MQMVIPVSPVTDQNVVSPRRVNQAALTIQFQKPLRAVCQVKVSCIPLNSLKMLLQVLEVMGSFPTEV